MSYVIDKSARAFVQYYLQRKQLRIEPAGAFRPLNV